MKLHKEKTWQHEATGVDGNTTLFGVNIFDYDWVSTGENANIVDPLYKQAYRFSVYKICINGETHQFAAGEFSNCVWGFYLLH